MDNEQELKNKVDKYFTERTKDLKIYFLKYCYPYEKHNFPEMLSELYLYVSQNLIKLKDIIETDKIHFWAIQFIWKQRNWQGTAYKKHILIEESGDELIPNLEIPYQSEEEVIEENIEKDIKIQNRLTQISFALHDLDLHEKILYDKYYIQQKSMREIGNDIGVTHTAIYYMIKKIRTKIRNTKIETIFIDMERQNNLIELRNLLNELEGKEKANPEQLTKLFNLHNYFNPKSVEYGKHCPSCVARVYRNIKNIYNQIKDELKD